MGKRLIKKQVNQQSNKGERIMAKIENWLPTQKNIEDYELLKNMLASQRKEFNILSKKKTNDQLNPMKINMVNRVLEPLRELFINEDTHGFLDDLKEDDMPTTSDVVLVFSQFETAIKEFKKKYYREDNYKTNEYGNNINRWMTKEYPPDYHANKKK
jgi:hypothetical protein